MRSCTGIRSGFCAGAGRVPPRPSLASPAGAGGGVTTNPAVPPRSRTSTEPGASSAEISSAAAESASSRVSHRRLASHSQVAPRRR